MTESQYCALCLTSAQKKKQGVQPCLVDPVEVEKASPGGDCFWYECSVSGFSSQRGYFPNRRYCVGVHRIWLARILFECSLGVIRAGKSCRLTSAHLNSSASEFRSWAAGVFVI